MTYEELYTIHFQGFTQTKMLYKNYEKKFL